MIDSDSGAVCGPGGEVVAVATDTVAQSGGQPVRVMLARSWNLGSPRVEGALPIAFVATRDVRTIGTAQVQ